MNVILVCTYVGENKECHNGKCLNDSKTSLRARPRELKDLVTQGPEAVMPECSEGSNKGLRVTKLLNSHRSQCISYVFRFTCRRITCQYLWMRGKVIY